MKDLAQTKEIQESFSTQAEIEAKRCPPDIFQHEASEDTHDGSMGISRDIVDYMVCLKSGEYLLGMVRGGRSSSNYAHSQTIEEDGEKICQFIVRRGFNIEDIAFIVQYKYYLHDWEGSERVEEESLTFFPIIQIDWDKIRRRIENRLRHDLEFVKAIALNNSINIY
jgi:hypothetical protein